MERSIYKTSIGLAKAIIELSEQYIEIIGKLKADHEELQLQFKLLSTQYDFAGNQDATVATEKPTPPFDEGQNLCAVCGAAIASNRKVCSNRCRAKYATKNRRDRVSLQTKTNETPQQPSAEAANDTNPDGGTEPGK